MMAICSAFRQPSGSIRTIDIAAAFHRNEAHEEKTEYHYLPRKSGISRYRYLVRKWHLSCLRRSFKFRNVGKEFQLHKTLQSVA